LKFSLAKSFPILTKKIWKKFGFIKATVLEAIKQEITGYSIIARDITFEKN
jgi:hypothetical protein